jgi:hypothetical protein
MSRGCRSDRGGPQTSLLTVQLRDGFLQHGEVFGLGVILSNRLPKIPCESQWTIGPIVTHTAAHQLRISTGFPLRRA